MTETMGPSSGSCQVARATSQARTPATIVGAHYYTNDQLQEGRAFVYHGSADGLSTTPDWTAESDQVNANFGYSVRTAGDVNGDGYADVIVGAFGFDNGQDSEGRAFLYHGSAAGLSGTPNWTAESDQASSGFGVSVGTAGDVNRRHRPD